MLTVRPASDSIRMPIRNEAGIASPISSDARPDSAIEDDDEDQHDRDQHTVLQIAEQLADRSVDLSWL